MKKPLAKLRTSIRLTVVTVFLLATTLTAALAIGLQYYFGQQMARETATELYTTAAEGIAGELEHIGSMNENIMALLASNPELADPGNQQSQLEIFTSVLAKNPLYYGLYLGRADSSFFEVINLENSQLARKRFRALPSDRWLVTTVARGANGLERSYQYLNEELQPRLTRTEPSQYDATARPWYQAATASDTLVTTEPYLFDQLGVPGQTLSRQIDRAGTVLGLDMTMSTLSSFLRDNAIAGESDIYLYTGAGQIIASSQDGSRQTPVPPSPPLALNEEERDYIRSLPVLKISNEMDWPPFDFAQSGRPRGYAVDLIRMVGEMTGIRFKFVNGFNWSQLRQQYISGEIDLLQPASATEENGTLGLPGLAFAALPFALATRADIDELTLEQLAGRTLAVPAGWSIIPTIRTRFPAIQVLEANSTQHALELVMAGEADAAMDNEIIMRYQARHYFLGDFRYHRLPDSSEFPDTLHILVPDKRPLLRTILDKAIAAISPAQRDYLESAWLDFDSEGRAVTSNAVPDESLLSIAANPDLHARLIEKRLDGEQYLHYVAPAADSTASTQTLYVGIRAPLTRVISPFLDEVKLSITVTGAFLMLLIPLSWLFANPIVYPIRQLANENDKVRRREYDTVERVPSRIVELDELSDSMVNMVEAIKAHELAQRKLMDSFIELIAQAIDDKSAYTGGHCARVPELALMLARQASDSARPEFRDFQLTSADQWREFRIAAWLHDCGKITTPEHIVDKGSKLETIYNRIHEVRTRFEVLWRDAEITYWKTLARLQENPHQAVTEAADQLEQSLLESRRKLQDDFDFVARCNVGGEFLSEEDRERLQEIANIPWLRYFDNHLGLSPTEELRVSTTTRELPARELLLSDKPEHLIPRTSSTEYPPEFAIDMDVPEYLCNLGEVYNLSISRGTLTAEDRFRINEHMISTIKMLESLPFPAELSMVPRFASTHHETMRGSGYPRKLSGDQLSIPERILAIADIFEALTASDRPYKKAKSISEAIGIMHRMVLDQHIDRDCFELFLREQVYLRYAREYLQPEQIDEVEIADYVS